MNELLFALIFWVNIPHFFYLVWPFKNGRRSTRRSQTSQNSIYTRPHSQFSHCISFFFLLFFLTLFPSLCVPLVWRQKGERINQSQPGKANPNPLSSSSDRQIFLGFCLFRRKKFMGKIFSFFNFIYLFIFSVKRRYNFYCEKEVFIFTKIRVFYGKYFLLQAFWSWESGALLYGSCDLGLNPDGCCNNLILPIFLVAFLR